jgi:hypothetical protein
MDALVPYFRATMDLAGRTGRDLMAAADGDPPVSAPCARCAQCAAPTAPGLPQNHPCSPARSRTCRRSRSHQPCHHHAACIRGSTANPLASAATRCTASTSYAGPASVPTTKKETVPIQIGNSPEYIKRIAAPAIVGVAIGAAVLISYLLFFLVSCCCKCCSKKRGCCQRAQAVTYCKRLPFVLIVVMCALLGLAGGLIVLQTAPALGSALNHLVKDQVDKARSCLLHRLV